MDDFQSTTCNAATTAISENMWYYNQWFEGANLGILVSAVNTGTEVDPDAFLENVKEVVAAKLETGDGKYSQILDYC